MHVVAPGVLPLLECHDRAKFQVFCYAEVEKPDAMTERFPRRGGPMAQHVRPFR